MVRPGTCLHFFFALTLVSHSHANHLCPTANYHLPLSALPPDPPLATSSPYNLAANLMQPRTPANRGPAFFSTTHTHTHANTPHCSHLRPTFVHLSSGFLDQRTTPTLLRVAISPACSVCSSISV